MDCFSSLVFLAASPYLWTELRYDWMELHYDLMELNYDLINQQCLLMGKM